MEDLATQRELQFENDLVKVWKTTILPDEPLKMHRHESGRVIVGIKGGQLLKVEKTGETSHLNFETGKAYWLSKDDPGTMHGDINQSNESIEVMVIEIKSQCH